MNGSGRRRCAPWLLVLAPLATAQGQAVPRGLDIATLTPERPDVREASQRLADQYERALFSELPLDDEAKKLIRAELEKLVDLNTRVEANGRQSRAEMQTEIEELLSGPDARSLRTQARLKFIFGQLDQVYLGCPLEPLSVATRVAAIVPPELRPRVGAVVAGARRRFVPLQEITPLAELAPGTPESRSALAVIRYRAFRASGVFDGALDLPDELDPPEAMRIIVPRFHPIAPPVDTWQTAAEALSRRLALSDDAAATVHKIVTDCVARGAALAAANAENARLIATFPDEEQRAAQTAELGRLVDGVFHEMKIRIYCLATAEHRRRAGAARVDAADGARARLAGATP